MSPSKTIIRSAFSLPKLTSTKSKGTLSSGLTTDKNNYFKWKKDMDITLLELSKLIWAHLIIELLFRLLLWLVIILLSIIVIIRIMTIGICVLRIFVMNNLCCIIFRIFVLFLLVYFQRKILINVLFLFLGVLILLFFFYIIF